MKSLGRIDKSVNPNRLSSTIGGNREMDNYKRRHKGQIQQGKRNFLTLVDCFPRLNKQV